MDGEEDSALNDEREMYDERKETGMRCRANGRKDNKK